MKKYSKKREAILNQIRSTTAHPSAEWVYNALKPKYPDLSLATVYRNIASFVKEGKIISVGVVDGQERYDGTTADHAHFICSHCGRILDVDVPSANYALIDQSVTCADPIQITRHELTFRGVCAKCSRETAPTSDLPQSTI